MRRGAVLVAGCLLLVGCGSEVATDPSSRSASPTRVERPTSVPPADGEVTTLGPVLVLDDGDGAELCVGGVAESYPPQCGGPRLDRWDWAEHDGDFDEASGVRFGEFLVTGTFDGERLVVTEVVPGDEAPAVDGPEDDLSTPCAEPEGGWRVLDPALADQDAWDRTMRQAGQLDGFANAWVDQSINPAYPFTDLGPETEEVANDPALLVINVQVTGDVEEAEAVLRQTWGGSLCVSQAGSTMAERRRIQDEMRDLPGLLYSSAGHDVVEVGVIHDDGSIQAWLDQEYGAGVVQVSSALVPHE